MTTAEEETVDVLVAGSAGALAGAYTAAREGLSVAIVEATDQFGGTFAYSGGGGMWYPCNPVLVRAGSDDTIDEALRYYRTVVGDRTPAELQETYVRGGAALIEYLEATNNSSSRSCRGRTTTAQSPVRATTACAIPSRRRCRTTASADSRGWFVDRWITNASGHRARPLTGGRAVVGRFLSAMADNPDVRRDLNTSLVELIVEDGRVTGGVVECDGERRTIRARRGVLLAAGGFEQNDEMRAEYGVPGTASDTMGAPGNTGLAHKAAIAAGASTDLMDQAWWSPGLIHPDGRAAFALVLHRRHLRRQGRAPIRQRVRRLRPTGPRDLARDARRHRRHAVLDGLRQPRR